MKQKCTYFSPEQIVQRNFHRKILSPLIGTIRQNWDQVQRAQAEFWTMAREWDAVSGDGIETVISDQVANNGVH